MRLRTALALATLATFWTALNACRPLLIDDGAYERYSRQFAERPLDPYGFTMFWYQHPLPANEVLAPPVLPAWWALSRLLGERPVLWKLALWPWALLLCFALHGLFRRFARRHAVLFVALVVLSPAFLPSFNLMLDVPALGLALAGLALFLRAADRGSFAGAAWAGLVAGVALETKYTAVLAPAAMVGYSLLIRRPGLGFAAGLVASTVFLAWEAFTALLYGRSHFLLALGDDGSLLDRWEMLPYLFTYLGGTFPVAALLGLAALGVRPRWLALGGLIVAAGYALIAFLPVADTTDVVCWSFAVAGALALVLVVGRLVAAEWGRRPRCHKPEAPARGPDEVPFPQARSASEGRFSQARSASEGGEWRRARARATWFLLLWLGLEVLGYLALTPFPATRRVLGVLVVVTLLLARLAARTVPARALRALAVGNAVLGLAFFALDWRCVDVHRVAAERSAEWARARGDGTIWYVGHWGFQFYAERAGMRPVAPDGGEPLRQGDWLVVPDDRVHQQVLRLEKGKLELAGSLRFADPVPLTTLPWFYGGGLPLYQEKEQTRLEVKVYRVTADFLPVTPGEGE
jgi:hypothetical protein